MCSVGQSLRNGLFEHAMSFASMVLVMPWLKYYINANPLVYPLRERFVQQISTSLSDIGGKQKLREQSQKNCHFLVERAEIIFFRWKK